MARRYRAIWNQLKKDGHATVRCNPAKAKTIIQAVKKEKSMENAPRKALDLPAWGELEIEKIMKEVQMVLTFKIQEPNKYSAEKL